MIRTFIVTAALAATLVACGSDSKSAPPTDAGSATTVAAGSDTTGAGSDTTSAATPSGDHAQIVTDYAVAQAATAGFEYDHDCVTGVVAKLSAADLELLYESTQNSTDPELSDDGKALGDELFACAKTGGASQELIDQALAKLDADPSSASLDRACIATQLATLTDVQLQALIDAAPDSTDPKLAGAHYALFSCVNLSTATT